MFGLLPSSSFEKLPVFPFLNASAVHSLGNDVRRVQEHSRANDSADSDEDEEELLGVKFHGRSWMMAFSPEI